MSLNLRQLEVFRAVMTTGSASAAAQDLNVSQPAVSRLLSQMEEALGLELFHREKGRLLPTAEATALFEETNAAFDEIQRLLKYAGTLRDEGTNRLRIAAPTSLSLTLLPEIVERFAAAHPEVSFTFSSGSYAHVEGLLSSAQADFGFLRLPVTQAGIVAEPLPPIPGVCVLPRRHPLAGHETIAPRDLRDVALILPNRFRPSRIKIEAVFAGVGLRPRIRYETSSLVEALSLAAHGLGVTVCNELMGRCFRHPEVVVRPFAGAVSYEYALARPSRIPPSRRLEQFFDIFRACAGTDA